MGFYPTSENTHTQKKKKLTTRCQMCSVLDNEWTWNFSKLWSVCIAHRGFMVLISLQGVNISTPKKYFDSNTFEVK